MNNKKIFIFDCDGVLANCTHRLKHIRKSPKDWEAFDADVMSDRPIKAGINLTRKLDDTCNIVILTGRSERVREGTVRWLKRHGAAYDLLLMRPLDDFRAGRECKLDLYREHLEEHKDRILGVYKDTPDICDMWEEQGLPVLRTHFDHGFEEGTETEEQKQVRLKRVEVA